jgi:hypothetical protein
MKNDNPLCKQCYNEVINDKPVYIPYNIVWDLINYQSKELDMSDKLEGVEYGSKEAYLLYRYFIQETITRYNTTGLLSIPLIKRFHPST